MEPHFIPDLSEGKAAIREAMRARLAALPPDERATRSAKIAQAITRHPAWPGARCVLLFAPLETEPELLSHLARAPGKTVAFPRIDGLTLRAHVVADPATLVPGRWGTREPDSDRHPEAVSIDVVLVPGLAFTAQGLRLGRGGGFYDRFLTGLLPQAQRWGVGFDFQLVPALPAEPHDVPMDLVITDAPHAS